MSYSYNKEKINNLLEDFNRFIDYLMSNEIVLTKKNKYLKRKDLYSLNQLMIEPQKDVTKHNDQERYIELNLFYHLVIAGNLFEIQGEKQGKKVKLIGNVQRLKKFDFLNSIEKYFALLKIFWIESNWQRIQTDYYNRSPIYSVPEVLDFVTSYNPGKRIDIPKGSREIQLLYNWNAFLKYFELFGFWEVFEKKTDSKKSYMAEVLITTKFGYDILKILNKKRNILQWNKHIKDRSERPKDMFSEILNLFDDNKKDDNFASENFKKPEEEFILPFKELFSGDKLKKTLPEIEEDFFEGRIVFEVKFAKDSVKKVELDGKNHTLHDLHLIIQKAFHFYDGHLYAFFMDGRPWSDRYYNSPMDREGPYANEVKVGNLDLYVGKNFLYIYDFGDDWRLQIFVTDLIEGKSELLEPRILDE